MKTGVEILYIEGLPECIFVDWKEIMGTEQFACLPFAHVSGKTGFWNYRVRKLVKVLDPFNFNFKSGVLNCNVAWLLSVRVGHFGIINS